MISDSTVHGTLLFMKVYMDASNSFPFLLLWDADSAVIVISCQVTKRFIILKLYLTEFLSRKASKGRFLKREKVQNHSNEGKGKEKEKE